MDAREQLALIALRGAQVNALKDHPGLIAMKAALEEEAGRDYRRWALAKDKDEAEQYRLRAQGFELFFSAMEAAIVKGEQARRCLEKMDAPPTEENLQ